MERALNRRTFVQLAAAASAGAAFVGLSGCSPKTAGEGEVSSASAERVFSHQTCPRNCHDTCSLISEVVDGKIVSITGDPDNPITAGAPCVKMNHYINWVNSPDRILYPMKRVGAKGEGKFERISWDEAYKTIVAKLNDAVSQYGPQSVLPHSYSGNLGFVNNYSFPHRFFYRLGASKLARDICSSAGATAVPYTYGADFGIDPENYPKTGMYVSWGINEAATNVHAVKFIKEMKENGGKLVVVNPVRTPLANFADLHLRPKPGTDAALALGVANWLIENGKYDAEYVEKNTVGFDKLKEKAAEYSLDVVERITGIPSADIVAFADAYGSVESSVIRMGYGIQRNTNGGSMIRAITLLPALTGMVGKDDHSGYVYMNAGYWAADLAGNDGSELDSEETRTISINQLGLALTGGLETTKETPISVMIVFNSNPVAVSSNSNLIRKGLEREDLFTVVFDIFATDTVDYADIVLPAATFFEYEDINQDYLGWYLRYNEPAIAPMGESKSNLQFFSELAKAYGFEDEMFDETPADVIKNLIGPGEGYYEGITYDRLKEEHWIKVKAGVPFEDKAFETPSGKIEFYSESLAEAGLDPVASYVPTKESEEGSPELFAKYPLTLLSPSTKNLLNSQMHGVPQIADLIGKPLVFVNPVDAQARGISDGDEVVVKNDRGEVTLTARVSEVCTAPGVLKTIKCPWPKLSQDGRNVNALTSDVLTDIGKNSTYHTNLVEIAKA